MSTEVQEREQSEAAFGELRRKWNETESEVARLREENRVYANRCAAYERMAKDVDELKKGAIAFGQAERERDTALGRVKELEAELSTMKLVAKAYHDGEEAAETALASARELLERLRDGYADNPEGDDLIRDAGAWLSSHPAAVPVAAPCAGRWRVGTRAPEHIYLDDKPLVTMPSADLARAVVAAMNAVAAPCAGCAEQKSLVADKERLLCNQERYTHELEQAIGAAVADLEAYENWPETHFPARALLALRAARAKEGT